MERLNRILQNKKYKDLYDRLETAEANRCFCRHDIQHFLAVARIMMLLNLQDNLQIDEIIIYSTAILHDIGRITQYEQNIPHEEASLKIAESILPECGFDAAEVAVIVNAIAGHRDKGNNATEKMTLDELLKRADKLSRNCFLCKASEKCNWKDDMKNKEIIL